MTPTQRSSQSDTNIQAQIDLLGTTVTAGFKEIKELLISFDARMRKMETTEAGCRPLVDARLEEHGKTLSEHAQSIKAIKEEVDDMQLIMVELKRTQRILSWVGGVLASTVIIWIITQLLGLV